MTTPQLTPNQVVAYNLRRARELRGLTQDEAGLALEPYLGQWSKALFSNAERSIDGKRIRPFDIDELIGFARAFQLPVLWFLLPPRIDVACGTAEEPMSASQYLDLLFSVDDATEARVGELFAEAERGGVDLTANQNHLRQMTSALRSAIASRLIQTTVEEAERLREIAALLLEVAEEQSAQQREAQP